MRNFPPQYDLQPQDALYFSHIPKTAGMTMRTIVEDYFHQDEVCPATLNAHIDDIPQAELEKYRLFRGHLVFVNLAGMLPDRNLVHVTVLREPVSRLISHYDYIRRTPGDPHYDMVSAMTIEEFSQKLTVGKAGKNIQTYYMAKTLRFNLEKVPGEEVLAIAKQSLDQYAFVGLLERFQDSLFLLSYILGWKPILNIRKVNAAENRRKAEDLPPETLDRLRKSNALDIELYRYAQEIFEQRFAQMCQDLVAKFGHLVSPAATDPKALSSETLYELLDRHYQARHLQLHPTQPTCLQYSFAEPLRGSGWQRREIPPEGPAYRWTGPTTISTLDLPVRLDRDLIVEFRVISTGVTVPEILDSLTMSVSGHPIPLTVLYPNEGSRLFQGTIPHTYLNPDSPFLRLTFEVCRITTFNAVNPRNPDKRQIGVAFNSLHVFPAELEAEKSAALVLFDRDYWSVTADFVRSHLQPGERVVVPLPGFKARLGAEAYDYETAIAKGIDFQWAVLHKGMVKQLYPTLLRLITKGFVPVLGNGVFVVLTQRKDLPRLSFFSPDVKSLYVHPAKVFVKNKLKSFYVKYFERNVQT